MAVTGSAMLQFLLLSAALPVFALPACAASAGLQQALTYAKAHQQTFNDQLMDLIAIPSISALPGERRASIAGFRVHLHASA
jgi:Na+/proline symporter